jgi:hypothetical protein
MYLNNDHTNVKYAFIEECPLHLFLASYFNVTRRRQFVFPLLLPRPFTFLLSVGGDTSIIAQVRTQGEAKVGWNSHDLEFHQLQTYEIYEDIFSCK